MEGVGFSVSPPSEAFRRLETLNRLASFIARVESKQGLKSCKQLSPEPQTPPLDPDDMYPFPCQECVESFPSTDELLTHQGTHHAEPKPYRCSGCGEAFSLRSSLRLHHCHVFSQIFEPQERNSPPYATALVSDNSVDGSGFDQPVILDNPYFCDVCGRGFFLKQALEHHQLYSCDHTVAQQSDDLPVNSPLVSEEDSSSSTSLDNPEGESVCKCCSRTFHTVAAFKHHNRVEHSDKDTDSWESSNGETSVRTKRGVFSCRSCEMVFSSTAQLSKHRTEKHSRRSEPQKEKDWQKPRLVRHRKPTNNTYTCLICSQVFFHHLSLWAHHRKHPRSEFLQVATSIDSSKDGKLKEKPKSRIALTPKLLIRKNALSKAVSAVKKFPPKLKKPRKFPLKPLNRLKKPQKVPRVEQELDSDDSEFPCPSCPEVFSRLLDLKAHTELHQSAVRRSRCSVCTSEMDSLKWNGSKRLRLYHCTLCQTGFASLEPFLTHCQGHLKTTVEVET